MNKPVLFLIFNRLDTTIKVFEKIREARPPRLYIASDGWRDDVIDEKQKVLSVREYVLSNIDWECQVKTKFNEKNLGCGKAVSSAITWFFENEPDGIILEDDCVPSRTFFSYCESLLDYYRDNKKIWHIGGYNFIDLSTLSKSYTFSYIPYIWGWATWADRWKSYKFDLKDYDEKYVKNIIPNYNFQYYWLEILNKMKTHSIDTWDYQWTFEIFRHRGLCVFPKLNMISNIGSEGVHFNGKNATLFTKTYETSEIIYNKKEYVDSKIMNKIYKEHFGLLDSVFNKIKIGNKRIFVLCKYFKFEYVKKFKNNNRKTNK